MCSRSLRIARGESCSGAAVAGVTVRTYSCNQVGDIENARWTRGLDACSFRDSAIVVDTTEGEVEALAD